MAVQDRPGLTGWTGFSAVMSISGSCRIGAVVVANSAEKTHTLTRERLAIHRQLHPKTTLPFKAEKNFRFSCLQQHGPSQEPFAPRLY
jgi:hypothetical protein